MAIYLDSEDSFANGEIIFNVINAKKYPFIYDAHEDEIKLYAEGREIDAVFRRNSSLKDGFKVFVTETAKENKLSYLSIMEAQKFNGFYVGIKNQAHHAHYITDKQARKIAHTHLKKNKSVFNDIKGEILAEMQSTYKKAVTQNTAHDLIGHISTKKTRSHSLRYQLLFPDSAHDEFGQFGPENKDFKMYHVYHGKLYELEVKFVGIFGTMVEYDIINLESGSIYVGLSISTDAGKTILPSSALYGKTKNDDGTLPTKSEAKLAKPKDGAKAYPLWSKEASFDFVGKFVFESTCNVIAKKHYEEKHDEKVHVYEAYKIVEEVIGDWFEEESNAQEIETPKTTEKKLILKEDVKN